MSKDPNDFTEQTKSTLAKRAGCICSNPDCKIHTSGPHSIDSKAINLGEAAHIKGAKSYSARYDPSMTPEERRDIRNGIWLCGTCHTLVDSDSVKYTVDLLHAWKKEHEESIFNSKKQMSSPAKEIYVKNGGIGSIIENTGEGVAEEIIHIGNTPAQKITVEGSGIGEIITNSGKGTAKRILKYGEGSALECSVNVTRPTNIACGLLSKVVLTNCCNCKRDFTATKVVQGLAGDAEPKMEVRCPFCGELKQI